MAKRPPDVKRLQAVKDVFFTANKYRLVDKYVLKDGKTHPFALVVPGGGYMTVCSFIEGVPFAEQLNARGISVFILYYRVKNRARFPAPQDDLARALKEILHNAERYRVSKEHFSVWGSSAGGHLVASFGTESIGYVKYGLPKPGALVLVYPVITMEEGVTHQGSRDALLGSAPDAALVEQTSIETRVTAAYPPTYLWCGDADSVVPPENTKRMAAALEAAAVPYKCEIFPGVDHGVGPGTGTAAEGWIGRAVDFWMAQQKRQ